MNLVKAGGLKYVPLSKLCEQSPDMQEMKIFEKKNTGVTSVAANAWKLPFCILLHK